MSIKGYRIDGALVILSGASSGIGFELAELLAVRCGCTVIGIGRRELKLAEAAEKIRAHGGKFEYRAFDVTDAGGWRSLAAELEAAGRIPDVLINNAGTLPPFAGFPLEGGADAVRKTAELNFLSQVYAAEIMLPLLLRSPRAARRRAQVSVASSASLCALPGSAAYSASKAAARAFTEALACEYRGTLYVASVCPGFTATPIFDGQKGDITVFLRFASSPAKMAKSILSGIRRGRTLIVRGADAHAMSILYRFFGTAGERLCADVLHRFGGELFEKCFFDNKKK